VVTELLSWKEKFMMDFGICFEEVFCIHKDYVPILIPEQNRIQTLGSFGGPPPPRLFKTLICLAFALLLLASL